jgi:multiple sugar transport system substrate-binding protein
VKNLKVWILFLILSITLLLTGCAQKSEPATVTFAIFGEPAELAAYESLVAAFEAKYPDIDIEIRYTPGQSEYRQRLASEFAGGDPSNVILLNYRRFAAFAAEGGLEPVESYLADSQIIHEIDFFPISMEAFRYDEKLWCIPQNISSLVIYYNRDLFDTAGIPYPANDWTWDDFLSAARALTQDLDGDGSIDQYGMGVSAELFRLAPFIWQNGGEIVDDPVNPTKLTLDTPEAREAFTWFVNLQVSEHVAPGATEEAGESSESRFMNGTLGMYFNSRRGVPTYRTITAFQWDVAPLPRKVQPAGILHSDAFCMTAATKNKEATWTFIEYANSFDGQTVLAQSGRTVPSLISVAASPAFLTPDLPPANSQIFLDTASVLRIVPIMPDWVSIENAVSQEIEKAYYGDATVDEAIKKSAQVAQPYFDKTYP